LAARWAKSRLGPPPTPEFPLECRPRPRSTRITDNRRDTASDDGIRQGREVDRRGVEATISLMASLSVQIFGRERDLATRAAIRFFKERRVAIHPVDLTRKPIARGELRRFVERLGARALLDETSRLYRDGGLGYMRLDDGEIVDRLLASPALLRLPLVRFGEEVTVGRAEAVWKDWVTRDAP
jgi:arsenate reductase-like glutaredoxin family protein